MSTSPKFTSFSETEKLSTLTVPIVKRESQVNLNAELVRPTPSSTSLPVAMASLQRLTLNVSGQDWLPHPNMDHATEPEIRSIEVLLDRELPRASESFIYIGRNNFQLVSQHEAALFRSERALRWEEKRLERITGTANNLDAALENCAVFAGAASRSLGCGIADRLGIGHGDILFGQFANGESRIQVGQSVRDRDTFIVQSIAHPVNDSLVEMCLTADALKRASARSITAVIPYFGYSRQDRKGGVRGPISARWAADVYQTSGIDRVVTIDIHAEQIEGFFNGAMDNLAGFPLMVNHIATKYGSGKITVVSPDAGGMTRAVNASGLLARHLTMRASRGDSVSDSPIRVEGMYKRRDRPNEVSESQLIGDGESVRDATCILVDDMLDTGGSALKAAKSLREYGAKNVVICATHALFSKQCVDLFRNTTTSDGRRIVDEVIVTDTLPLTRGKGDLITVVSVETLLAEAIKRICRGDAASLRELSGFCGSFDP